MQRGKNAGLGRKPIFGVFGAHGTYLLAAT